jgi:hypothetical protein
MPMMVCDCQVGKGRLPPQMLERWASVTITLETHPTLKAIIRFECAHGRVIGYQSCFPGSGADWSWCERITGQWDSQRCGVSILRDKAA